MKTKFERNDNEKSKMFLIGSVADASEIIRPICKFRAK